MAGNIKYIPSQMDPLAGASTSAARQNPLRLMMQDAGVLITMLPYLPYIFLPLRANDESSELYLNLQGARDMLLQSWLFIMETNLLLMAVPAFLALPGAFSITAIVLCSVTVYLVAYPMEGPRLAESNMDSLTETMAGQHKDERWLFVNGCATGHSGLQKNIDRISRTFGRAVVGIHNKTYGLPADVLECIIQRTLAYRTNDVRMTYSYVKAVLVDPTVHKVILIGHSQGGIVISLVLDQLFAELPTSCMSKLEIYTFGCAASHFSNPLVSLTTETDSSVSPTSGPAVHFDLPPQPKHVISHIEHYANEYDMVARWGVLHCTQDILNNRYAGSVFVRMGSSGHLFNQHYMDAMFPLPNDNAPLLPRIFLDGLVKVDEKLAMKREDVAIGNVGVMRRESGLEFGDGQVIQDGLPMMHNPHSGSSGSHRTSENPVMTFARTSTGRLLAEEAQGKTVRELSRLWRYQGGRSPHTPTTYPTINGEAQWLKGSDQVQGLKAFSSLAAESQFTNGKSGKNGKVQGTKQHQRATTDLSSPSYIENEAIR
ncbi:hypothetical protein P7C71_g3005, partial [Lecanoromycetidae sp. Uapishka_2]